MTTIRYFYLATHIDTESDNRQDGEMDIAAVTRAADIKLESALALAKENHERQVSAARAEHAKAMEAIRLIHSDSVLDAIRLCESLVASTDAATVMNGSSPSDGHGNEQNEDDVEEPDHPLSITELVRLYARKNPAKITMPDIARFAENYPEIEAARNRISDVLYKLTRRTHELELARRGTGNRPGVWRVRALRQEQVG